METSAKTGFNAENLFVKAGKVLYNEYLKYKKKKRKKNFVELDVKTILII